MRRDGDLDAVVQWFLFSESTRSKRPPPPTCLFRATVSPVRSDILLTALKSHVRLVSERGKINIRRMEEEDARDKKSVKYTEFLFYI